MRVLAALALAVLAITATAQTTPPPLPGEAPFTVAPSPATNAPPRRPHPTALLDENALVVLTWPSLDQNISCEIQRQKVGANGRLGEWKTRGYVDEGATFWREPKPLQQTFQYRVRGIVLGSQPTIYTPWSSVQRVMVAPAAGAHAATPTPAPP